ncbi:HAD family hydrolase [Bradyrhizobium sp. Cp5.3]|uniref:HAD family hydrolase n=1 Tax=Bradyrhizobium sp. Cp5.3 TaxID=443598 RepID=UPI00041ED097|nr:HAD family hydrolase [Bradyrhizobium sp. Cp5.3]
MTIATVDAKCRTQNVSAWSFDVFDTFLVRACTTPDGVFERTYELSGVSRSSPSVSASFVQHRIQAEARARKTAKDKRGASEVHVTEIYSYFPFRLFGLERRDLNDLVDAEFDAELALCRANPDMLRQYLDMKRAGHCVGFISDTYWDSERLAQLLRACWPGLTWDFLYASCDHGSSKSEALFAKYLSGQGIDAAASFHVGDNEKADIRGARRHGIRPRYYPQATPQLASIFQRETALFELLCQNAPSRLDDGARTLRRMVAAGSAEKSPAFHLGLTILGPVMTAFNAFVARRCKEVAGPGRQVALGFLGRDGFLSHRIWQGLNGTASAYLEINRRVSLIASADTIDPLVDLLSKVFKIDATTFHDMMKITSPKVVAFFARFPGGIATGEELAAALPDLMDAGEIVALAAALRRRLLAYLRYAIPGFDDCTDLVLADLGYSGSVQKALRRVFDQEGIKVRLHGAYLISLDDAFDDIAEEDCAEGFISDLVITPHAKRMLSRNVALLEQACCSADGSVRDYEGGTVLREINPRPASQIALAAEIQAGALAFAESAVGVAANFGLHPYAAPDVAARWSAATLARLLLLPDEDELALLGGLKHDVNLGTHALAPMLDSRFVRDQITARGLSAACASAAPPMWLAGSFARLSPSYGYLYVLFGANRLPADVFEERPCGSVQVGLFRAGGDAALETVTIYRTGLGELRLRIPLSRTMAISMIALPLAKFAPQGLLHRVTVQQGEDVREAAESQDVIGIADASLVYAGIQRTGEHYRAETEDGCLLIPVAPMTKDIAVYSVAIAPLGTSSR